MKVEYSIEELLVILGAYLIYYKRPYFMITYTSYCSESNELRLAKTKSISIHEDPLTQMIELTKENGFIGFNIPNKSTEKINQLNSIIVDLVKDKEPEIHVL